MPNRAYAVLVMLMLAATGASIADFVLTRQGQASVLARLKEVEGEMTLLKKEVIDTRKYTEQTANLNQMAQARSVQDLGKVRVDLDELRKGATPDDPDSLRGLRKQLAELRKLIEKK